MLQQRIIRRSRWVDGEHTLKIDLLGQFDFQESCSSCWKSSSHRRETETKRGRDSDLKEHFLDLESTLQRGKNSHRDIDAGIA